MKIPGNNSNRTGEMWETWETRPGVSSAAPPPPLLRPSGPLGVARLVFPCCGELGCCPSGFAGP